MNTPKKSGYIYHNFTPCLYVHIWIFTLPNYLANTIFDPEQFDFDINISAARIQMK